MIYIKSALSWTRATITLSPLEMNQVFLTAQCFHVFLQWTPLGFTLRDPNSLDDISKERFEGTVLKAISKHPRKEIKKEPEEHQEGGAAQGGQVLFGQVRKQTNWKS